MLQVTSPYYYPNINGFSYAMAVLQHPYEDRESRQHVGIMMRFGPPCNRSWLEQP